MERKRVWSLICAVGVALAITACSDSGDKVDSGARLEKEIETIDDYLASKGETAVKDLYGVRMVISELGSGFPAQKASNVSVDYEGKLFPDGATFDAGTTSGSIQSYIAGWQIALSQLPEGSRARVYIPSYWAYGTSGQGSIPGNSILQFDVYFKKITRSTADLQRLGTDSVAIDTYLTNKGLDAVKDSTGMRYIITQQGTGAVPTLYDKVKFHIDYKVLTDDTKVVATQDIEPNENYLSRPVDQLADGVKKLLYTVPVGTKVTGYLPSILAFGTDGAKNANNEVIIPANSNVIVEIELKEIK